MNSGPFHLSFVQLGLLLGFKVLASEVTYVLRSQIEAGLCITRYEANREANFPMPLWLRDVPVPRYAVSGESGAGKSSFMNRLRSADPRSFRDNSLREGHDTSCLGLLTLLDAIRSR